MPSSYYEYWEEFVSEWFKAGGKPSFPLKCWTDPDPVLGSVSQYLPEPWWGNDGDEEPLHCVVINYNPGEGGPNQEYSKLKHWYKSSYANDIVKTVGANLLTATADWHNSKRALPVLDILHDLGCISEPYSLRNHLSIELIPWHTKDANKIDTYIHDNIEQVYEYCLKFAANESKRIANAKLKNKVLLRMSCTRTQWLLKELANIKHPSRIIGCGTSPKGDGHYMVFEICDIPDVQFISIWGSNTRNDFPEKNVLKDILGNRLACNAVGCACNKDCNKEFKEHCNEEFNEQCNKKCNKEYIIECNEVCKNCKLKK